MEKLQATLRDLQRQEMDLLASLEAIDQQFEDLGFPLSTVLPKEDMREPSSQLELKRSGLRIGNELSFRGQEKAGELFRMMDSDCDGLIGYEDVRAMSAFNDKFGIIRDGHYQSKAAFAAAMRSLGIPSREDGEGQLSEEAFKLLRVRIDDHQPLSRELLALNLGLLPAYLTRWSSFKQRLAKVMELRPHRLNEQELVSLQDRVSAEEFQQVLSLSSVLYLSEVQGDPSFCPQIIPLTRVEVARLLLLAKRKAVALQQLQRVASKRMIAQTDFPFVLQDSDEDSIHHHDGSIGSSSQQQVESKPARLNVTFDDEEEGRVTAEDLRSVPQQTALALLLSLPFSLFHKDIASVVGCSWYRWGMNLRSLFFANIRELYHHHGRLLFALAGHVNDRLLFRDFVGINQMSSELTETSSIKYSLSIGGYSGGNKSSANDLSGLGMSFKLLRLDGGAAGNNANPASSSSSSNKKSSSNKAAAVDLSGGGGIDAAIRKLGGAPGAGTALCLDLLCKSTATAEEITSTAIVLRQCLLRQVEGELKAMQGSVLGLFVLPAVNEGDDAPVIRILLVWKRAVSVDRWLEHCLLPYKLIDLLPAMAGDIRTSIDLKELLSNRVNSLDDLCSVHVSGLVNYRRGLIVAILERMRLAFAAGLAPTAANSNSTTSSQSQQQHGDDNRSVTSAASSSVSTATAHHAAVNDRGLFADGNTSINDDEEVRHKRKAALIPYYSTLKEWSMWMIGQLQPLGLAFTVRLQYRSLSQFLSMIVMPRRLQSIPGYEELLSRPGAVRELFAGWTGSMGQEMWKLFESLRAQLEAKKKQADAARLAALMTITVKQPKESAAVIASADMKGEGAEAEAVTIARLQRLGVSEQEAVSAINSARAGNDTKHIIDAMESEQRDRDVLNLRCLDAVRKTLLGIHAIDILSGRSKLAITCTGLDFIELLLPSDLPPMQRAVDENQIKRGAAGGRSRATSPEKV